MSTAPKNASQVEADEEHGSCLNKVQLRVFDVIKNSKKKSNHKGLHGQKAKIANNAIYDRKDQKTGVDMCRPEKPPSRVVTQPVSGDSRKRCGFVDHNKISLSNQSGESLRKLKFRIETLSKSKSQIQGHCNPLYCLRRYFKRSFVNSAHNWELQKIKNLLVGGLVHTSYPVGISLSKNIQLVVASTTPIMVRRLVSCLPFWPTSYTMPVLSDIAFLLKKVSARHRSLRL